MNTREKITAELGGLSDRCREALHAAGIGEPSGSRYGRKFDYHVTACVEEAGGAFFASFQINQPRLMVFRVEPEQVRALANELTEIADRFDKWERERHATPAKPDALAIHVG